MKPFVTVDCELRSKALALIVDLDESIPIPSWNVIVSHVASHTTITLAISDGRTLETRDLFRYYDSDDWQRAIGYEKRFAQYCPWEIITGEDWVFILIKHPEFSNRCAWNKLDLYDWDALLYCQPQFRELSRPYLFKLNLTR